MARRHPRRSYLHRLSQPLFQSERVESSAKSRRVPEVDSSAVRRTLQSAAPEGVMSRQDDSKKSRARHLRWRARRPEKWRAMRAAQQRRYYRQFQPTSPTRGRLPDTWRMMRELQRRADRQIGGSARLWEARCRRFSGGGVSPARTKSHHRIRPKPSRIERTASRVRGADR
jgi:hypothetical protein